MKSQLHIIAGYKNQKTYLKQSYCNHPFKLGNITEEKNGSLLQMMIMSTSPGVLDRDQYSIEISIEENAELHLVTQAYQRLFTMNDHASQHTNVYLHDNASFWFLPHPNVPHAASDFSSVNNIYLSKKHNLVWSDIITCGRKLSGEEFKFTKYHNVTNVYINNKLAVKENVLLEPALTSVYGMGQMEGYTHQSTLLFMHDHAGIEQVLMACKEFLEEIDTIAFGISALPVNGLVCRLLGQKSEQLFNCNNKLASIIQQLLPGNVNSKPKVIPSTILSPGI